MLMTVYHGCSSVCGTMQASSSTDRLQVCGGWIYVSPRRDEGIAPYKSLWQYRIILSADTASEVPQLPERYLSRKAGIVRCCLRNTAGQRADKNSFKHVGAVQS